MQSIEPLQNYTSRQRHTTEHNITVTWTKNFKTTMTHPQKHDKQDQIHEYTTFPNIKHKSTHVTSIEIT